MLRFLRLAVFALAGFGALPGLAQTDCSGVEPYVFVLLDSSGSMNWAPLCSSDDLALGLCSQLCPTGDCWVPRDGDDPASKWVQVKQSLYQALDGATGLRFGFATFNQDQLRVRAKHWNYRADGGGPIVPGWGPFPAVGDREVVGASWACGTGTSSSGVGCSASNPADLSDAWELERMRQWPKGGVSFATAVTFYVRHAGTTYLVRYTPLGAAPPAATIAMTVRLERCLNTACSSRTLIGAQAVAYSQPEEFVSWALSAKRMEPELDYFPSSAGGLAVATNTCGGWDSNEDSSSDSYAGYSVRQPTMADPRGLAMSLGDRVPLDWENDHRTTLQQRLAPNLLLGESTPDFGTARYLRDTPVIDFLQLRNEAARPLVAVGSTPVAASLAALRAWLLDWEPLAGALDPDAVCRPVSVVLITDGDETCGGNACAEAAALGMLNIQTHVVFYGADPGPGSQAPCIAFEGGTTAPIVAHNPSALASALEALFADLATP